MLWPSSSPLGDRSGDSRWHCLWGHGETRSRRASVRPRKNKEHFLRIERDAAGHELALQTAIVRFESDAPERKGFVVDLIGAVHVGEKAYYQALNKQFEDYDAVLYELVAPEGTRVPKGSKPGGHPVAFLQNGMKDLLGLEHQLEYIDYSRANLVHADMSPKDFAKSMEDRNESVAAMLVRMMAAGMARQATEASQAKSSDAELLMALFDRNRGLRLKRLMADQFADLETAMAALERSRWVDAGHRAEQSGFVQAGKAVVTRPEASGHFLRSRPFARHGAAVDRRLQASRNRAELADGVESFRRPRRRRRGPNCRARRRFQVVSCSRYGHFRPARCFTLWV